MISGIRLDMLELMGRGYVIDYCIACFQKRAEEKLFMTYVAESLKIIAEMSGLGVNTKVTMKDFRELAGWMDKKHDDRNGDEIAADIIKRAGLRFKK